MNDSEGTARTPPVHIPPELVLAILNSVDKGRRVATTRNARLVSRSWSNLLLRSLYRDVSITLTEADDHNLDALCTFFGTHPDICGHVHSLALYDKAAEVPKDRKNKNDDTKDEDKEREDEDEDADEGDDEDENGEAPDEGKDVRDEQTQDDYYDEDGYVEDEEEVDFWTYYRCSVDPDLLKRTLSHLPRLHDLRLHNILPSRAATLDHGCTGTKGIHVQNLRIILPVWEDDGCSSAMHIILSTLGIFDKVDFVTIKGRFTEASYVGITEPVSTNVTASQLQVQNWSLLQVDPALLNKLAQEPVSSAISTLETGSPAVAHCLDSLLAVAKPSLRSLRCKIPNLLDIPMHQPGINLSVCNALNSLMLDFPLYTYGDFHAKMVEHVNKTLVSLTRRARTASALSRFVLHMILSRDEPGDAWPLAREEMRAMEDILLNLVVRKVCSVVHVETDLQAWYAGEGYRVGKLRKNRRKKGKEELDSRWLRYAAVCEEALRQAWPRLDERGALAISTVPVTLKEEDPDFYPEPY